MSWRPATLNSSSGPKGRYKLKQDKELVAEFAYYQARHNRIPLATKPRIVTIELHRTDHRLQDPDNRDFARKSILDALSKPKGNKKIGVGLIVDDSAAWCESTVTELAKQPHEKTVIRIYERGEQ